MKTIRRRAFVVAMCGVVVGLAGCGGESPFAATSVNGSSIVLKGTVLSLVPVPAVGFSTSSNGADATITVTVVGLEEITATVNAEGGFVLRGLPEGTFTILFGDMDGNPLGTLTFDAVLPNQELTISVEIMGDGTVMLLEEHRNGIGHAGLEIQGTIDAVPAACDPNGDNLFSIAGFQVVVRPLTTAIREGNTRLTVCELAVGDQVHVKGVWLEPEAGTDPADQQVLAHEIKLQDDADLDGEKVTICHKGKNTLSISVDAWPAHAAHGDTLGACS